MDKAYVDYKTLYEMHLNETYLVTRTKATMKYDVVDINYNANDLVGIVGDKTIHLSGYVSEKKYPEDLRLIEFYDAEKDEVIAFITNNFELGLLIIANIYLTGGKLRRSSNGSRETRPSKLSGDTRKMLSRSTLGSQSVLTCY